MAPEDLKRVYKELKEVSGKVYDAAYVYRNGRNAKIRASGGKDLEYLETKVRRMLEKYPDVYECFKEVGGTEMYSDFFEYKYFSDDMGKLVSCIENKINADPFST